MPSRRNEVSSVEEFYAHALHIERETAARYWEFANQLLLFRQNEVAAVFLALAQSEYEDLDRLERQAAALRLPALASSDHRWHIEDEGEEALPRGTLPHEAAPGAGNRAQEPAPSQEILRAHFQIRPKSGRQPPRR